jgi:dienelactone hydrolase
MLRRRCANGATALAAAWAAIALAACSSGDRSDPPPEPSPAALPASSVRSIEVSVAGLPGTLALPARGRGPFPAVVLVGGSGPVDRDETVGPNKPFRDIAVGLAERGIASLRYDKRTRLPAGVRAARRASFTPTQEYVPDAVAAVRLLRRRAGIDRRRIFVLGHSHGGTFAPRVAAAQPAVAGVILFAASAQSFGDTLLRQTRYLAELEPGESELERLQVANARRQARLIDDPRLPLSTPRSELPFRLGPHYWLDLSHYDAVATARELPQPLLVLQGGRDYQVTVADDLRRWRRGLAGRRNVAIRVFPRANHLFINGSGRPGPAEYERRGRVSRDVVEAIAGWILAQ